MKVFKKIDPSLVTFTTYEANKKYSVIDGVYEDLNIKVYDGSYLPPTQDNLNISGNNTFLLTNGKYQHIVHYSIDHLFYKRFYDDVLGTMSGYNVGQCRELNNKFKVFSISQKIFGDSIKPFSIELVDKNSMGDELFTDMNTTFSWWNCKVSDRSFVKPVYNEFDNNTILIETHTSTSIDYPNQLGLLQYTPLTSGSTYRLSCKIKRANTISSIVSASSFYTVDRPFYLGFGTNSRLDSSSIVPFLTQSFQYVDGTTEYTAIITNNTSSINTAGLYFIGSDTPDTETYMSYRNFFEIEKMSLREIGISRILKDDGMGNMYDTILKPLYFDIHDIIKKNSVFNYKFMDGYKTDQSVIKPRDFSIYKNNGRDINISYTDTGLIGAAATFNNSYVVSDIPLLISSSNSPVTIGNKTDVFDSINVVNGYTGNDIRIECSSSLEPNSLYRLSFYNKNISKKQEIVSSSLTTVQYGIKSSSFTPVMTYPNNYPGLYWNKLEYYVPYIDSSSISPYNYTFLIEQTGSVSYSSSFNSIVNLKMEKVDIYNTIKIPHTTNNNIDTNQDFCLSCIVKIPTQQKDLRSTSNIIVTKSGRKYETILPNDNKQKTISNIITKDIDIPSNVTPVNIGGAYPYRIEIINNTDDINNGKIRCSVTDGKNPLNLVSTTKINTNTVNHILFQRTGSLISLYINGNTECSCSNYNNDITTGNDSYVFIGSNGDETMNLTGKVEQVFLLNKALTPTDISTYSTALLADDFSYNVGNVFYEHGMITMTNPSPKYQLLATSTGSLGYELEFRNRVKKVEVEVVCQTKATEFNHTLNPTGILDIDDNLGKYNTHATHSEFRPYATSMGLYNNSGQLLAVGKISVPVKRISGMDTNFIGRFDID